MTEEELRRDERIKITSRLIYPLVAVFASMFVAVGISITYTTIAVHRDEQTWCELVGNLDDQYQASPPPTANGKVFARQIHNIRIKFSCK